MADSFLANSPITRREAAQLLGVAATAGALAAQTPDICFLTATEMARLIRRRKLSAHEAIAAHLKQIERVNPKVNAIVTLLAEQATENARKADEAQAHGARLGLLHGLPVVHKDLFETAGIRTTFGSPIFRDNVPKRDAIIVERINGAGAICLGKSNTPKFGAGSQTFNTVFGATKNIHMTGSIVQVLVNLLDNALKYSLVAPSITLGARVLAGNLELCVSDFVSGIAEENLVQCLRQVRSRVRRGETAGVEPGLSVCKRLDRGAP